MAVVAAAGCGHGERGPERAAHEWVDALRQRDWGRACRSLVRPPRNCRAELASEYGGRVLALLPAGAYASGDDVTDNRTRFALRTTRQRRDTLTYFVVRKADGRWGIDPRVSVQGSASSTRSG